MLDGEAVWGVTVLEAEAEMDAGPVWASVNFPMRPATKSSRYRREVTDAAVEAVTMALARVEGRNHGPVCRDAMEQGRLRPLCRQTDRLIEWQQDSTDTVLQKIRCADGMPGVRDTLFGRPVRLFDAHRAESLAGAPGATIARCDGALARATRDGAVWIGHVREERDEALKLPATHVFAAESVALPVAAGYAP